MAEYPLAQIDAFTCEPLRGNACAVVYDADDLSDETMLLVAREMNLSETSFVLRSEVADVRARYFTPAGEIPLAGHPTIATLFGLVESGRLELDSERTVFRLELPAGVIPVEVRRDARGELKVTMSQKAPAFLGVYDPERVLPAFGLSPADMPDGATVQTVSTGTPQLMVPLRDIATVRRAQLDFDRYGELRAAGDFFSAHLFCLEGATPEGRTFARHFAAPPDLIEDPFTGSATGGMACYLWRYGLIEEPVFVAEQGHDMRRPGSARVEVVGTPEAIETVRVGGSAVTVFEGSLRLP